MRILLVDDDAGLRAFLRTTFEAVDVELEEADDAPAATEAVRRHRPDVVVLDVHMPGGSGLDLCRDLKADPATDGISVVLLTGSNGGTAESAAAAGANAFLRKPFSPLELLSIVERLAGGLHPVSFRASRAESMPEQLQLYARDLRHLLEIERGQRLLLAEGYRETVTALATALETKDSGTAIHSQRVQHYGIELARALGSELVDDPSAEYGFLLHDVGKIGIPDRILQKPGPLSPEERTLMRRTPSSASRCSAASLSCRAPGSRSSVPTTSVGMGMATLRLADYAPADAHVGRHADEDRRPDDRHAHRPRHHRVNEPVAIPSVG